MMPESATCTESPISVLHVDDSSFDRALIRDSLAESDFEFQLLQATSKAEFEAYLETPADVILSDFNILGYNGLEVIDQVQKYCPHIPVIIVTGTGTEEIAVEALKRGAADYVIKTVDHLRRLPMTIRKVLDARQMRVERDRAQQELAASERRLQRIIDGSKDGMWDWPDVTHANLWWSPRFYEIIGYTPAELPPNIDAFTRLIHADDRQRVVNDIAVLSQREGIFESEYRIRVKSGRDIWVQTRGCTATDPESGVMYMSGTMRDVTANHEVESRIRASESRLRRVIEGSSDGIWEWTDFSRDGFWWSARIFEILGYRDAEFVPNLKRFSDLLHPDERESVLATVSTVAETEEPFVARFRLRSKAGEYVWVESRGRTFFDDSGQPQCTSGTMRDLTHELERTQQLKESKLSLNTIMRLAAVGGFEWDLVAGTFVVTDQWQQIHGVEKQSFTEEELKPIAFPDDWPKILAAWKDCRKSGASYNIEHRIIHQQSQEVRWIRVLGAVDCDISGPPKKIYGAVLDITDEKLAQLERENRNAFLQRLLDNIPSPVFFKDANLRYQGCNPAFADFFGMTAQEIAGRTVGELAPSDLANIYDKQDRELLATGGEQCYEAPAVRHDGSRREIVFRKATYCDADGNVDGLIGVMTDVTERKQGELAVRISQERLASAVEGGRLGIWDWDLISDKIVWDGFHESMFGFLPGEFDGTFTSFESRIHPNDLAMLVDECRLSLQQHRNYNCDYRIVLPDGTIRWINGRGRYVWDEQDHPIRMIGTVADITDRKRSEAALRDLANFLQSTLDALSANIAILDQRGNIIATNAAWNEFAVANGADLLRVSKQANYLDVCDQATGPGGETASLVASGIRAVLSGTATDLTHEYDCHSPEEERWFVVRVSRFYESGEARAVVAHEAITRRVMAERETRRRETELAKLFEMAPARLMLLDDKCRVRRINREASKHFHSGSIQSPTSSKPGVLFECVYCQEAPETVCPRSDCAECTLRSLAVDTLVSGHHHYHEKHRFKRRQDEEETESVLMVSTVRVMLEERPHVLLYFEDITDQEFARKQLRIQEANVAHLSRVYTVGEMATALAHELNQPLYAINNYASGIQFRLRRQKSHEIHDQLVTAMAKISAEVDRAGSIISHLREFVRAREPQKIWIRPEEIIQRAFNLLDLVARENGIEYEMQVARDLPEVFVDSIQIEQVIINLVTNAIDASVGLDQERRKLLIICRLRDSSSLEFEVQDAGRGLSLGLDKDLFEPFATNKKDGLGVGLSISKSIIHHHGGDIWMEPRRPHGSAFHFTLPTQDR
jgi:PAS domain S-box-containing protein